MGNAAIFILKGVIALSLVGSVGVQAMILPAAWKDLDDSGAPTPESVTLVALAGAVIVTMQVFAVCVWRLLTLVRTGAVFSSASFGYINVIIGAFAVAAALCFAFAVILAPGEAPPGLVGLFCGAALVLGGIALLVIIMRRLLDQAIERDAEARLLRSELDEVV